jgi:hypothetical protein
MESIRNLPKSLLKQGQVIQNGLVWIEKIACKKHSKKKLKLALLCFALLCFAYQLKIHKKCSG